jgi:hypothetical protein
MNTIHTQSKESHGIRPWHHVVIFLLSCTVVVSRRPDAILHAQFYAEDGHVWFADAYNLGWWHALLRTWASCFQTMPRLGASLALLAPVVYAPFVLNLIAVAFQAFPANLLLSSRSAPWGSLRFRILLAILYLALPNTTEVNTGITDAQWPLALSAFLVIAAHTSQSAVGMAFDLAVVLLCGFTGPFCIFLLPIALVLAWTRGESRRWLWAGALAMTSVVQLVSLVIVKPSGDPFGHREAVMGASAVWFSRILAGQIYLADLVGWNELAMNSGPGAFIFLVFVAIAGTVIVAACFLKSKLEMRLFLLFSGIILMASLISPTMSSPAGVSVWQKLAGSPAIRYWFFPTLAFAWTLLWCLHSPFKVLKIAAAVLLCVMCIGICRDWSHPVFPDKHFEQYAKRFESTPAGAVIIIPENPEGWYLRLVKHSDETNMERKSDDHAD